MGSVISPLDAERSPAVRPGSAGGARPTSWPSSANENRTAASSATEGLSVPAGSRLPAGTDALLPTAESVAWGTESVHVEEGAESVPEPVQSPAVGAGLGEPSPVGHPNGSSADISLMPDEGADFSLSLYLGLPSSKGSVGGVVSPFEAGLNMSLATPGAFQATPAPRPRMERPMSLPGSSHHYTTPMPKDSDELSLSEYLGLSAGSGVLGSSVLRGAGDGMGSVISPLDAERSPAVRPGSAGGARPTSWPSSAKEGQMHRHEVIYERFLAQYLGPSGASTAEAEPDRESGLAGRLRPTESAVCQWGTGSVISPLASEMTPINSGSASSLPFTRPTSDTQRHDPGLLLPLTVARCCRRCICCQYQPCTLPSYFTEGRHPVGHAVSLHPCRLRRRGWHSPRPLDALNVLAAD